MRRTGRLFVGRSASSDTSFRVSLVSSARFFAACSGAQEAQILQRLFSTFPDGWLGLGLLFVRLAAGFSACVQGVNYLVSPDNPTLTMWFPGLCWTVTGILLVIGFLTPVSGGLVALGGAAIALGFSFWFPNFLFGSRLALLDLTLVALATVLAGPGAFSLDFFLFGRREIIIPETPRSKY